MSGIIAPYSAAQITAEGYQIELMIRAALLRARTAIPVKVAAVYPGTGSPPSIGTVDVQPLVETVDGSGRLWSLGTVYGAPFVRLQGGTSAVVLDPQVGDIGLAVVCDRDITSVLATGAEAAPGSARTHNLSDIIYIAPILGTGAIEQYVQLSASGITMVSPQQVTIQAPQISLKGTVAQTGGDMTVETKLTVPNVDATSDVTVPNGSVNSHTHPGVQSGGSSTGEMTG